MTQTTYNINKCWQYSDKTITFYLSKTPETNKQLPSKIYLTLDINQMTFGLRAELSKPKKSPQEGSVVHLVRKHLIRCRLCSILQNKITQDIWLKFTPFNPNFSSYYIHLIAQKPPLLAIINSENQNLLRFSTQGTYTKIQTNIIDLPDPSNDEFKPIFQSIIEESTHLILEKSSLESTSDLKSLDISSEQRTLIHRMKRKLKTLKGSLQKQTAALPSLEEIGLLTQKANFLRNFLYLVKDNDTYITLPPELTNLKDNFTIELSQEISAGENLQTYFREIKQKNKSHEIISKLIATLELKINPLTLELNQLNENPLTPKELVNLKIKYDIKDLNLEKNTKTATKQPISSPFRQFQLFTGEVITVGKGPHENDIMTKNATSNDLWLHLVTGSGSHVIIRKKTIKPFTAMDKLIRSAAILAIHYSQSRTAMEGEVYVTAKANIKKQKGMAAGLWKIEKAKTLHVNYTTEELEQLLHTRNN